MASSVIHLCVAKEVAKKIKVKNENDYLLGSIAPDINQIIEFDKEKGRKKSHLLDENNNIVLDKFLNKYSLDNILYY